MNTGNSVRKAIDDWEIGELDASMLHACNAIDGTAAKLFGSLGSNARFTRLLRERYWILGPMGVPGINLDDTRFPIRVEKPKAPGGQPDLADVIYGVHRCSHGHGRELPDGFTLISNAGVGGGLTQLSVEKGAIRLSDRIIFGLLAVAVLSPANLGQQVPQGYFLSFGRAALTMPINEWWGRELDFPAIAATEPMPSVKLDFGDWMW